MSKSGDRIEVKEGLIDFAGGSLGGIASVYVGQPLDTVKVKMQTFPSMYKNMTECFMTTLRTDGIYRGLYAGTIPALTTNVVENSILFMCYGFCQKMIQKFTGTKDVLELSMLENASAGCLASFFSSIAICPTELLKCKLQALRETASQQAALGRKTERVETIGSVKLIKQIVSEDGPLGLFRGLVPVIVREMPGYFFFFGAYEGTRSLFTKPGQSKDDIGLFRTWVAGSVGGICFWVLTYPADLAKSRIQVASLRVNMFSMIFSMARTEGVRALYYGLTPTVVRTIPATGTLFVVYEYSKRFFNSIF